MGPKTAPAALPKLKVEETKIELGVGEKRVLLWWLFSLIREGDDKLSICQ